MLMLTRMIREVATRATYTTSGPSSTATEADSWVSAASRSRCGWATSGSVRLER